MTPLLPLPPQPDGVAWPSDEWPTGPSTAALDAVVDEAFTSDNLTETLATLVVQGGRIISVRSAGALARFDGPPIPVEAGTTLTSWSMAKSVLHAIVGMLVAEGRLTLDEPAPVPGWEGDERRAITLRHLLEMRDGLDFTEDYVDGASDVIDMLWGSGAADVAAFAAAKPLAATPGERFSYSSGTTNIISAIVARVLGPGEPYERFLRSRLFDPIGMRSATPGFDEAGTWIASSFCYATARDFARFGMLYLRDGVWEGTRLLPAGWVDEARTQTGIDGEGLRYGAHWWVLDDRRGTFQAVGYEGQRITVCPALDAVVVRLGKTDAVNYPHLRAWVGRVLDALSG
ncbi:MAG: hypothetical protein NVS3B21_35220 [Acidimicrobiales bacterium]